MKSALNIMLMLFLMIGFFACGEDFIPEGTFSYRPEKPQRNEQIKIYFNKDSTKLEDSENIDLTAYYFGKSLDKVELIPLTAEGDILTATVTPSDSTLGILLNFTEGNLVENNSKKGFVIQLYDDQGNLLSGANAGLAAMRAVWGSRYAELERDRGEALQLFDEEFEINPEVKTQFLNEYFTVLKNEKPAEANSQIKAELNLIEEKGELDEEDYAVLTNWYLRLDTAKYEEYQSTFREKYPQNEFFQDEKLNEIYSEKDIDKKLELLEEYKSSFPKNENRVTAFELTANYYRDANDFEGALEFLKENQNEVSLYRFYSVGNKALENNADPETVKEIAELGVERGREDLENPDSDTKPVYLSDKGWKDETEQMFAYNLFVLAKAENELKNQEDALEHLKEAYKLSDSSEAEINELYGELLLESGNAEEAMGVMERSIESGKSTAKLKDNMKKAYIAKNGNEENFEEYISQFESTAEETLKR